MLMQTNEQIGYLPPDIEAITIAVEQGYSMSATIGGWDSDDEDHEGAAE